MSRVFQPRGGHDDDLGLNSSPASGKLPLTSYFPPTGSGGLAFPRRVNTVSARAARRSGQISEETHARRPHVERARRLVSPRRVHLNTTGLQCSPPRRNVVLETICQDVVVFVQLGLTEASSLSDKSRRLLL
ncbi:unnamed protein product [Pleuronectes platessa]|uniref:Uncharacterized protein n=1 Tax=Pleuronectes platessa TaxID=8262 RepID=A0A9N7Z7C6_PLEPL|nr:unnamed protein product [Pleuronectes platessa]